MVVETVRGFIAQLGFCEHPRSLGALASQQYDEEPSRCPIQCGKPSPGSFLKDARVFKEGYRSSHGLLAFDIPAASSKSVMAFQQMANAFVESKTDVKDTYWPCVSPSALFEGPDVFDSQGNKTEMGRSLDIAHIKEIVKKMFIKQVSIFQINKKNRSSVSWPVENGSSASRPVEDRSSASRPMEDRSSASRPMEFKSAKEVINEIRFWPKRDRKRPYPGTRQRSDPPHPPKVIFRDAVVQTVPFPVARNRVGWLLPCKNGKFLFVKPFPGKKMGLAAWVGGDHGFGPEVIAKPYHQAIDALPASCHSSLQLQSSSGRRITRPRGWADSHPQEDEEYEEDEELDTDLDVTGPHRLRRLTSNNYREQDRSPSRSPMPSHARERHASLSTAVTVGEDLTVTPSHNLVASPGQQNRIPSNIKRSRSPSPEIVSVSPSKRTVLDCKGIEFHFVPDHHKRDLLSDSKPDSLVLLLSNCSTSEQFFVSVREAWEQLCSKPPERPEFSGVRCTWDGRKRALMVPWGNAAHLHNVLGMIRDTKETGGSWEVDVSCMRREEEAK